MVFFLHCKIWVEVITKKILLNLTYVSGDDQVAVLHMRNHWREPSLIIFGGFVNMAIKVQQGWIFSHAILFAVYYNLFNINYWIK